MCGPVRAVTTRARVQIPVLLLVIIQHQKPFKRCVLLLEKTEIDFQHACSLIVAHFVLLAISMSTRELLHSKIQELNKYPIFRQLFCYHYLLFGLQRMGRWPRCSRSCGSHAPALQIQCKRRPQTVFIHLFHPVAIDSITL